MKIAINRLSRLIVAGDKHDRADRKQRRLVNIFGAGLVESLEHRCPGCPDRHLLAARCVVAKHELQSIRPDAQRIGAIDEDLAGKIAEPLYGGFCCQPRRREYNDLYTLNGLQGRAESLRG